MDDVYEIVGAEMALLAEKYLQNAVAFARALAAGRTEGIEVRKRTRQFHLALVDTEGLAAAAG